MLSSKLRPETQRALAALNDAPLLRGGGQIDLSRYAVVWSVDAAMRSAASRNWERFVGDIYDGTFTLELQRQIRAERGDERAWLDILEAISPALAPMSRKLNAIKWIDVTRFPMELLMAPCCRELEIAHLIRPVFFYPLVFPVLCAGHFPCGWQGEPIPKNWKPRGPEDLPRGQLRVHPIGRVQHTLWTGSAPLYQRPALSLFMTRREHEEHLRQVAQGPPRPRTVAELLAITDSFEFLEGLAAFGSPYRCASQSEFEALPKLRRGVLLLRGFYLRVLLRDLDGFIEESVGRYISDLKHLLQSIEANQALKLIGEVEEKFPGGEIPADDDERCHAMRRLEDLHGDRCIMQKVHAYLATREDTGELMKRYVRSNKDTFVRELSS